MALKDDALTIGIPESRYWRMTYVEAGDEIEAWKRRHKAAVREQQQVRAVMDYNLAALIRSAFAGNYPKSPKVAYPDLFSVGPRGWRESKAQWQKYAAEFNQRRGEKK